MIRPVISQHGHGGFRFRHNGWTIEVSTGQKDSDWLLPHEPPSIVVYNSPMTGGGYDYMRCINRWHHTDPKFNEALIKALNGND